MKPDWSQIERYFDAVIREPADRRETFLRQQGLDDADLIAELLSLAAAHDDECAFLDEAVPVSTDDEGGEPSSDKSGFLIGQLFGPYRMIEKLGEGGMGAVYLAERSDGAYQQQVAIKLITDLSRHDSLTQRLQQEREILARLTHPNISRILDGGCTPEGQHYVVMEYIEGDGLIEYIRQHQPSLSKRLQLFAGICDAVRHAHQRLVIHCDLKPGNIIVNNEGVPVLLDFGVARLLRSASDSGNDQHTYLRAMTPDYASPEQIRQTSVDTRTDLYSLGVILYEMLTLERPYDYRGRSLIEMDRIISGKRPLPPGKVTGRHAASIGRGRISADLDAIIMRSIEVEPDDRYSSVSSLENDLQAWQQHRPVSARPLTRWYRLSKALRRYGVTAVLAVALMLSLSALLGVSRLKEDQLARAQHDVLRQSGKAQSSLDFLDRTLYSTMSDDPMNRNLTAMDLLDSIEMRLEVELQDEPGARAAIHFTVAGMLSGMEQYDRAIIHARKALQLAQSDPYTGKRRQIEIAVALANNYISVQELDEADRVLTRYSELAGNELSQNDELYLWVEQAMGALRTSQGRFDDARRHYERALDLYQRFHDLACTSYGRTSNSYWHLLVRNGYFEDAMPYLKSALDLCRVELGNDHHLTQLLKSNLGLTHAWQGEYDKAQPYFDELLKRVRTTGTPAQTNYQERVKFSARNLLELGRYQDAADVLIPELDAVDAVVIETVDRYRPRFLAMLAEARHGLGQVDEAESMLLDALALSELPQYRYLRSDDTHNQRIIWRLARFYWREGRQEQYELFRQRYQEMIPRISKTFSYYLIEKPL